MDSLCIVCFKRALVLLLFKQVTEKPSAAVLHFCQTIVHARYQVITQIMVLDVPDMVVDKCF